MSHNNENIQGATPSATSAITGGLDNSMTLGYAINHSSGETGAGSGNYAASDNYIFFTGADNYAGIASVSSDTITIPKGTFFIQCIPTFGDINSSLGNTELRAQFVDEHDTPLGNKGAVNRDYGASFPASGLFSAYVEGPATITLKIDSVSGASHFPKNGVETIRSPFFLDIIRIF